MKFFRRFLLLVCPLVVFSTLNAFGDFEIDTIASDPVKVEKVQADPVPTSQVPKDAIAADLVPSDPISADPVPKDAITIEEPIFKAD